MKINTNRILNPEYEICPCRHIKTKDVLGIIESKNITTLKELCKLAGIGDKCGGCREELSALLSCALDEEMLTESHLDD